MSLSQRQYAAHRRSKGLKGGTLKGVQDALSAGRIQRNAAGKLDPDECDRLWIERTDPARHPLRAPQSPPKRHQPGGTVAQGKPDEDAGEDATSYWEARRRREWIAVEEEQLDLSRKRGEVVDLASVNAFVAGVMLATTDELTRIGPELQDRLALESDVIACGQLVRDRHDRVLEKLAALSHGLADIIVQQRRG